MPRKPLFTLRLDDDVKTRWDAEADRRGYSLSEFVRLAVDDLIDREAPKARAKRKLSKAETIAAHKKLIEQTTTRKARTTMCEHRLRPDQFCGRCDS